MKLATVEIKGQAHFGAITDQGFVDLGARFGARCSDLVGLFANDLLAEAQAILAHITAADHPLSGLKFFL